MCGTHRALLHVSVLLALQGCYRQGKGGGAWADTFQEQQKTVIRANQFLESGDWSKAAQLYRQLLEPGGKLGPLSNDVDKARVLSNLALAYRTGSRFDLALDASQRAVAVAPSFSDAHFGMGQGLAAMGRDSEAAKSFGLAAQAATSFPHRGSVDVATATVEMAQALARSGQRTQAVAALAELPPASTETLQRAAAALDAMGEHAAAAALRRRAPTSPPQQHPASSSRPTASEGAALQEGERLMERGALKEAARVLEAAVAAWPDSFQLRGSLALALSSQGRHALALPHLEHAARLQPTDAVVVARLMFSRAAVCDWRGQERERAQLEAALAREQDCGSAFKGDCVEPLLALYLPLSPHLSLHVSRRACLCAQRRAAAVLPRPLQFLQAGGARRLRVAYLTSDVRSHATAYLARSLWALHDRRHLHAAVFMTIAPPDASGYFEHVAATAEELQVLGGHSDLAVAEAVNRWGADVLVDLNGWVKGERSEVVAMRPAPAQVHYMAYLHSLGCPYYQWLVSDRVASSPELAAGYGEALLLLPASFLVTDHRHMAPPHPPSHDTSLPLPAAWRASLNLSAGGEAEVVVGNLNALYKLEPRTLALALRVLQAVDGSVLWVQQWSEQGLRNLRASADAMGLPPSRLRASVPPPTRYLHVWNAHALAADLHLDSLQYNAVTLATDLLWLAVPALTLPALRMCSRVGASLAAAAGASWLAARTEGDLEDLARLLARSAPRRTAARARLARAAPHSALFDTPRWVRAWERALRLIHRQRDAPSRSAAAPRFHLVVAAEHQADAALSSEAS